MPCSANAWEHVRDPPHTDFLVEDSQLLLLALLRNLLRKELLQALANLVLLKGGDLLHSVGSGREPVDGLELETSARTSPNGKRTREQKRQR